CTQPAAGHHCANGRGLPVTWVAVEKKTPPKWEIAFPKPLLWIPEALKIIFEQRNNRRGEDEIVPRHGHDLARLRAVDSQPRRGVSGIKYFEQPDHLLNRPPAYYKKASLSF